MGAAWLRAYLYFIMYTLPVRRFTAVYRLNPPSAHTATLRINPIPIQAHPSTHPTFHSISFTFQYLTLHEIPFFRFADHFTFITIVIFI